MEWQMGERRGGNVLHHAFADTSIYALLPNTAHAPKCFKSSICYVMFLPSLPPHSPPPQGYFGLDFMHSGKLTGYSDVYSFGMVLLQLATGKEALITSGQEIVPLRQHVLHLASGLDGLSYVVDQSLLGAGEGSGRVKAVHVGATLRFAFGLLSVCVHACVHGMVVGHEII
ncbi:unnamed protein product [Closterium sp. NIES-54]